MKSDILSGVISLIFLTVTIRAIRKKQLTELLAILWLSVSIGTVILSALLPFGAFTALSHFFGIAYPSEMFLVFGLAFVTLFTFRLSVALSRLSARQKTLVQELALMRERAESERPQ
jgi:hypothetical protein